MEEAANEAILPEEVTAPRPKPAKSHLAVTYLRESSPVWNRARLRKVIETPADPETTGVIAHRRAVLRHYAPQVLHNSYGGQAHPGREGAGLVSSDTLSISPAYGAVLYNLARSIDARLIVEDGAGFGISSMYLAAAARETQGGTLLSFEISGYAALAQASVNLVDPASRVIQGDFTNFNRHLSGTAQISFAFIDAVHEKDSMLRSFKSLIGWMAPKSMIVVDDLSYSESAREAFRTMIRMELYDFVCIVNNRFGVLIRG